MGLQEWLPERDQAVWFADLYLQFHRPQFKQKIVEYLDPRKKYPKSPSVYPKSPSEMTDAYLTTTCESREAFLYSLDPTAHAYMRWETSSRFNLQKALNNFTLEPSIIKTHWYKCPILPFYAFQRVMEIIH